MKPSLTRLTEIARKHTPPPFVFEAFVRRDGVLQGAVRTPDRRVVCFVRVSQKEADLARDARLLIAGRVKPAVASAVAMQRFVSSPDLNADR